MVLHPPQVEGDGLSQWPMPGKLHVQSNKEGNVLVCVCVFQTLKKYLDIAFQHHNEPLYSGSVVDELLTCVFFLWEAAKQTEARVVCCVCECVHTWTNVCLMENWGALQPCFAWFTDTPETSDSELQFKHGWTKWWNRKAAWDAARIRSKCKGLFPFHETLFSVDFTTYALTYLKSTKTKLYFAV